MWNEYSKIITLCHNKQCQVSIWEFFKSQHLINLLDIADNPIDFQQQIYNSLTIKSLGKDLSSKSEVATNPKAIKKYRTCIKKVENPTAI